MPYCKLINYVISIQKSPFKPAYQKVNVVKETKQYNTRNDLDRGTESWWKKLCYTHRSRAPIGYVLRGMILLISVVVFSIAGAALGFSVFDKDQWNIIGRAADIAGSPDLEKILYGALGAVSAGLILAFIRELLDMRQHSISYFLHRETSDPVSGYLHAVVTAFFFSAGFIASAIAYNSYQSNLSERPVEEEIGNVPESASASQLRLLLPTDNSYSSLSDKGKIAFLLMFYEDATEAAVKSGHGPGLRVSNDQLAMLKSIAESATACSTEMGGRSELLVIGNASSEPFDRFDLKSSNELNRLLANRRAELVSEHLKHFATKFQESRTSKPNSFITPIVNAHEWRSYEDMIRARRFHDRDMNGDYIDERARFTRSVEIRINKAGECNFQNV